MAGGTEFALANCLPMVQYRSMTKKIRVFREIGKVVVNFGSLTFASLVLGTILRGDYDKLLVMAIGFGIAVALIVWGIIFLTKGEEE
jgi:hypothetical protein